MPYTQQVRISAFLNGGICKWLHKIKTKKYLFDFKRFILFSGSKRLKESDNTVIRHGDFYTIFEVINFVKSIFHDSDIKVTDPTNETDISILHKNNIIAVGGPNNNPVVKTIFDKLKQEKKLPYYFNEYCIESIKKEKFCLEKQGSSITKDYGLIYVIDNPFSDKRVIIFAGCKSFGTYAAVKVFTSIEFLKYKNKEIKSDNFVLLIECNIDRGRIVSYSILKDKTYILDKR